MRQLRTNAITGNPIDILKPRHFGTAEFPIRASDITRILSPYGCLRAWFYSIEEYNTGVRLKSTRWPATVRGTVIHATLDELHQTKCFDNMAWIYMRHWRDEELKTYEPPIKWESRDERRELIREGFQMVEGYFSVEENRTATIVAQEAKFNCNIRDRYFLTGTVDQIRQLDSGYFLLDWKTGNIPNQLELDMSWQLGIYAIAMLKGTFFIKSKTSSGETTQEHVQFKEFPSKLGLQKMTDHIPYEQPTAKEIKYRSEAEYYGVPIGTKIKALTPKNNEGHPLLQKGLQRGPGFYESFFNPDLMEQIERSIANVASVIRLGRYWTANHAFACGACPYKESCHGLGAETGLDLTDFNFKTKRKERKYVSKKCAVNSAIQ